MRQTTKDRQDELIEQMNARDARKKRVREVARALLEQCAGEGFSVRDLETVCEFAVSYAKKSVLSILQE